MKGFTTNLHTFLLTALGIFCFIKNNVKEKMWKENKSERIHVLCYTKIAIHWQDIPKKQLYWGKKRKHAKGYVSCDP